MLARIEHRYFLLFLAIVSLLSINPRINGWNEASRMALTQSLVEQGTFIIDESVFTETGDKVFIQGHFYSDKPPIPSILAAAVYFPLYKLGLRLDYGWNAAYFFIILFTMKIWWIMSILAFGQVWRMQGGKDTQLARMMLVFALASLTFTWSATFNNHSLAASWLMIALMYFLRGRAAASIQDLALSGLFFGLAGASDVPTGIFLLGFGVLLLVRREFDHFWVFMIPGLIPLGIYAALNFSISGSLIPVQIVGEYFQYEGSVWGQGLARNSLVELISYGTSALIGSSGFIWYNPLLILLVPLTIRHIRRGGDLGSEGFVIAVSSFILMMYYFLFTQNLGGWSYSIRWFVPILPLVYIFLLDLPDWINSNVRNRIGQVLIVSSIVVSCIGLINPWSSQDTHRIPIVSNLKQLIQFVQ